MARSEGAPVRESPQLICPRFFHIRKAQSLSPRERNKGRKVKTKKRGGAPPFPRFEREGGDFDFNRNHHWRASKKADEWLGSIPSWPQILISQDFTYKPLGWHTLQLDRPSLARKPNGYRALRQRYPEKDPNLPSRILGAVITI
jgi:hypothetical protein